MNRPFLANRWRFGRFTIDLLSLLGKITYLSFQNNTLKGLLFIELRKYQGAVLDMSLKEKYCIAKKKGF